MFIRIGRWSFVFLLILCIWTAADAQQNAQQNKVGSLIPVSSLGTPADIPKPTLTPRGGTLVFSDSPEELTSSLALPGAMYRSQVQGEFRVFYHHQNVDLPSVTVGLAITNTSSQAEILLARGRGEGLSIYPDVAGQTALAGFLSSQNNISFLKILLPGESYFAVQKNPEGDTASGIKEYLAIALPGGERPDSIPLALFEGLVSSSAQTGDVLTLPGGFRWGAATVTTLAYTGDRPSQPARLPVLPADSHVRGTFEHFNRFGSFTIATSGGLQDLSVDTSPPGEPYADDMPGEYELGVDQVDGGIQVYNDGNYGVMYYFRIVIDTGAPVVTPFALLMEPAGGSGQYEMFANGHLDLSPYVSYVDAWWFDELNLRGPRIVELETSLPGGAAGPQELLFDPKSDGQ